MRVWIYSIPVETVGPREILIAEIDYLVSIVANWWLCIIFNIAWRLLTVCFLWTKHKNELESGGITWGFSAGMLAVPHWAAFNCAQPHSRWTTTRVGPNLPCSVSWWAAVTSALFLLQASTRICAAERKAFLKCSQFFCCFQLNLCGLKFSFPTVPPFVLFHTFALSHRSRVTAGENPNIIYLAALQEKLTPKQ